MNCEIAITTMNGSCTAATSISYTRMSMISHGRILARENTKQYECPAMVSVSLEFRTWDAFISEITRLSDGKSGIENVVQSSITLHAIHATAGSHAPAVK